MAYSDAPRTLAEIEALPVEILSCAQISKVLCSNPSSIHDQAVANPSRLGFPVIVHGTRVKIPRLAFIEFMKGKPNNAKTSD